MKIRVVFPLIVVMAFSDCTPAEMQKVDRDGL